MVNIAYGTIEIDFAGALKDVRGKVIVDCVEGVCKQTQGYIRDGSTKPLGYAFVGEKVGAATANVPVFEGSGTIAAATGCISTSVGQIITDGTAGVTGICYGVGSNEIKFETGTARNIILKGMAVPGTPFADRVNAVAIKRSANYIIRDRFYTAGIYCYKNDKKK